MDNFSTGFITGLMVGPLLLVALLCIARLAITRLLTRIVSRWAANVFWRAVEKCLTLLEELLARKREREAGHLGSPNLISPAAREMVSTSRKPSVR